MQAVVRQLVGSDVVTDAAGFRGLVERVADEPMQVLFGMRDYSYD